MLAGYCDSLANNLTIFSTPISCHNIQYALYSLTYCMPSIKSRSLTLLFLVFPRTVKLTTYRYNFDKRVLVDRGAYGITHMHP